MADLSDSVGMTPGRKIKAFLWMVVAILACVFIVSKVHTPDNVAIQALWTIGVGGMFLIGGQALVDSVEKWASTRGMISSEQTTTINKNTVSGTQ